MTSAADIEERLSAWKRGELTSDRIEQWARAELLQGRAQTQGVNEVLARLQAFARIDVSREDVEVIEGALRSPDAHAILQRHFAGRREVELPHGRVAGSVANDPILRGRAKELRITATRQRRVINAVVAVAVLSGVAFGLWLEFTWLAWGGGAGIGMGVAAGAALAQAVAWGYRRRSPMPACPFCRKRWSMFDDEQWKHIEAGRCPKCKSLVA